jgi:Uma2 family endonuclease
MAGKQVIPPPHLLEYRESDGRPMGETPLHRDNLMYLVQMLRDDWYRDDQQVYVSGNLYMYYVPGDRYRSVVPDVFVARGIPRLPERRVFKTWEEQKTPDLVIELTSRSTQEEDEVEKFALYRDTLKVTEYFLFDPEAEYLTPPLQGYRLAGGRYAPIGPADGRLPSEVLGLHLVGIGGILRLYDPAAGRLVPTPPEAVAQAEARRRQADELRQRAEHEWRQAEEALKREEEARKREEEARRREAEARRAAEAEAQRLRQELEALRRRLTPPPESAG